MSAFQNRQYQTDLHNGVYAAWEQGHQNVGLILPTGGGKSRVMAGILKQEMLKYPVAAIAHRMELVSQIALALARNGVRHCVIGSKDLVKLCVEDQMKELGASFYAPNSRCTVVAVRTLLSRAKAYESWAQNIGMWALDEGHHLLRSNEWGKAIELMKNARGLAVTATMCRADKKGLGRHADGVLDTLVLGQTMRELIDQGYLCDYQIVCADSDLKMMESDVGSTGDYSQAKLKAAAKKSHIVGDAVVA